jgi:hypothetical protein
VAVADTGNNRVLVWRIEKEGHRYAFKNGQAAWQVLGQPDFYSHEPNTGGLGPNRFDHPYGVSIPFAHLSYLAVADTGNNRIVYFKYNKTSDKLVFDSVFGQPDAKTKRLLRLYALDETTLNRPKGVSRNFVADFGNHRILEFKDIRVTGGLRWQDIGWVFGQDGRFNSGEWNLGGAGPASLAFPRAVARNEHNELFVADFDNHRVLVLSNPTKHRHQWKFMGVVGQRGDSRSRVPNCGGPSARSLFYPVDVAADNYLHIYVADMGNHRVLRFPPPFKDDPEADRVFGQGGDFTTRAPNKGGVVGAGSLRFPSGVAVGPEYTLFISDTGNNRVLVFQGKKARMP